MILVTRTGLRVAGGIAWGILFFLFQWTVLELAFAASIAL